MAALIMDRIDYPNFNYAGQSLKTDSRVPFLLPRTTRSVRAVPTWTPRALLLPHPGLRTERERSQVVGRTMAKPSAEPRLPLLLLGRALATTFGMISPSRVFQAGTSRTTRLRTRNSPSPRIRSEPLSPPGWRSAIARHLRWVGRPGPVSLPSRTGSSHRGWTRSFRSDSPFRRRQVSSSPPWRSPNPWSTPAYRRPSSAAVTASTSLGGCDVLSSSSRTTHP